jgi:hypothetical protein
MGTTEQPLTTQTGAEQNVERDDHAIPPENERKYGGIDSRRRIYHLLEEMFGPSRGKQIQGLLEMRKSGRVVRETTDEELKEAYQRGRSDLQAEIVFSERLAAIREKYADFDNAWRSVRPLVPRTVWAEMADHPEGLESAYQLSKLPELCQELSELGPQKARERFQFFVRDLQAITKGIMR